MMSDKNKYRTMRGDTFVEAFQMSCVPDKVTAPQARSPLGSRRSLLAGLCGLSLGIVLAVTPVLAPASAQAQTRPSDAQQDEAVLGGSTPATSTPAAGSGAKAAPSARLDASASAASSRADGSATSTRTGSGGASQAIDASGSASRDFKDKTYQDIPADALVEARDVQQAVEDGAIERKELTILDIRSHRDYVSQMIEGSINVPAGRQIDIRMDEIPRDREVVLVSLQDSDRLAETWYMLVANGYDPTKLKVLDGGVRAWIGAGFPTTGDRFLGC